MLVYLAAPLCSEAERAFNLRVADVIRSCGFSAYVPQLDAGVLTDMVTRGADEATTRRIIFEGDCAAVNRSDLCLAILDGRVIDEGVCFELGLAFAARKVCLGFKTDSRAAVRGHDNLMVEGALSQIARNWEELHTMLRSHRHDNQ